MQPEEGGVLRKVDFRSLSLATDVKPSSLQNSFEKLQRESVY
jgi:hypothetical protein